MVDPPPRPSATPLSSVAIPERPPKSSWLQTTIFTIYFMGCIVLCHSIQVLLQPFKYFAATEFIGRNVNEWAKGSFGRCLVNMSWTFSPSNLVLSFRDEHGQILDPDQFVDLNPDGSVSQLNLPKRSIWISNHQVYTDWLYLWIVLYFCRAERSVYIILKDSLKWVPMVGPAMQWFDFIFLARSWAKDQRTLSHHLAKLAKVSHKVASPLNLFIFPEGTLVSPITRPQSKSYADKVGLEDCRNLLLPRSTGLLYCARALKRDIDELVLVDATIGYPGVPSDGYGQSYYTLRSIYMQGVPPPSVHISITLRKIKTGPPPTNPQEAASDAGNMPVGDLSEVGQSAAAHLDLNAGELERRAFDAWLLARWREKDSLMDAFYRDGDFVSGAFVRNKAEAGEYYKPDQKPTIISTDQKGIKTELKKQYLTIPIRPRHPVLEILNNYAYGVPILLGWAVYKLFFSTK